MVRISVLLRLVTALTVLVPRETLADDALRIQVAVGETVERDVGFAMGIQCDDLTIIHAELRARTPASNTFVVTGVTEGVTLCRTGTVPTRPTYLFEIHVVAARRPR
ncbi:MAG TPA: hypothetical protein VFT22_38265 [Kofleriaceae bacterium]|nr:hypothetical protein [Kofleriaceae bacterium]